MPHVLTYLIEDVDDAIAGRDVTDNYTCILDGQYLHKNQSEKQKDQEVPSKFKTNMVFIQGCTWLIWVQVLKDACIWGHQCPTQAPHCIEQPLSS